MKNLIQFTIRKDNVYGSQASGAPGELRAIQSEINVAFFVLTSPLLGQIVEVVQVVPPELGHIGTDPVDLALRESFFAVQKFEGIWLSRTSCTSEHGADADTWPNPHVAHRRNLMRRRQQTFTDQRVYLRGAKMAQGVRIEQETCHQPRRITTGRPQCRNSSSSLR